MGIWVLSFLSWKLTEMELVTTFQLCNCTSSTVISDHFGTDGTQGKWTCTQHARSSCSMLLLLIMLRPLLLECSCAGHVSSSSCWCFSWSPAPTPTSSSPKQINNKDALWRSVALGLRVCEGPNYSKKNKISNREKWKKISSSFPISLLSPAHLAGNLSRRKPESLWIRKALRLVSADAPGLRKRFAYY
jgi:hypothetical protein